MKILAICGSPHRGNCFSVLNTIKGIYSDIDYKILMLNEVNLGQCLGCYVCVLRGEDNCPLNDGRETIVTEMLDADGVVFASPVYVNHATALMKNFIERLGYLGHRPRFYDKYAMVIAVCGMFGAEETNEFMKGIFTSFGFNVVSSLELQVATKSEKETVYNRGKISDAFDKFIAGIENGRRTAPPLDQLVRFNIFKSISRMNKERFVADYQYYKDKADIPYRGKINPLKKKLAGWVAKKMIKEFLKNR